MYHFRTKYLDHDGTLQFDRYHDDSTAISLFSPAEGPLATATVCLSQYGETPAAGHVFIKNHSESEGMLDCLYALGIVGYPVRTIPMGFTEAYECELLVR